MTIKETCKKYGYAKEGDILVEWDDAGQTSVPFRRKRIHPFFLWLSGVAAWAIAFYALMLLVGKVVQIIFR